MIVYSASDAISPAINRTKGYLFHRFRFWTYIKLCLVAVLTDGASSFAGNSSGTNQSSAHSFLALPGSAADVGVLVILPAVLLALALVLWIWYLLVRLRFAYFHCLVYQIKEIGPGWRLYAQPAMRMFQFQLVVVLIFLAAVALLIGPFFFFFRGALGGGAQPGVGTILSMIVVLIPFVFALIFLSIALEIITHDFMLPHMALEGITIGEAWHAARLHYLAERGSFWFYGFLRFVLAIIGSIAGVVILIIPIIFVGLSFFAFYSALHSMLADASGFALFVRESVLILVGTIVVALATLLFISISGPIATWKRYYSLLFYGGRFPQLGDLLSPPPPPPFEALPGPSAAV